VELLAASGASLLSPPAPDRKSATLSPVSVTTPPLLWGALVSIASAERPIVEVAGVGAVDAVEVPPAGGGGGAVFGASGEALLLAEAPETSSTEEGPDPDEAPHSASNAAASGEIMEVSLLSLSDDKADGRENLAEEAASGARAARGP